MRVYFLYLFILNILFSFNINNAKDTDWIDLANTISEDKMILIKNYIQ